MRVLLCNPPGRRIYIRDYFCSKTTKSNYLFHPVDLVVLSGTLSAEHELEVLDCIAERLDQEAAEARIDAFAPDVVLSLVGSVSWDEDRLFLARQHERGRRVLAIGDVLQEDTEGRLKSEPWLEAVLHDFSSSDVLEYLRGNTDPVETMTVRESGGRVVRRTASKARKQYRVPRPRHELFPREGYHFSFARHADFATVLTDYGCPYPCTFCVIGTLGFKTRPVEDVFLELDSLTARGVREIFFMDQTFGLQKERGLALCAELEKRGGFSWTAFTRPDTGDRELLSAMKRAGCHTVIMGVESASDETLEAYRKGYAADEVRCAVDRAREIGLRTVGTFILGLPEETKDSLEATLEFAIDLDLDFMSINLAVPRFGTPFRAQALELGLARREDLVMDQGGADAFLPTSTLDRDAMLDLKKKAVRRFYLRPGYLWRRLKSVRSWYELKSHVLEGAALLRRNV